jgi:hypothetical protein
MLQVRKKKVLILLPLHCPALFTDFSTKDYNFLGQFPCVGEKTCSWLVIVGVGFRKDKGKRMKDEIGKLP